MKAALVAAALLAHQQLPPPCYDHPPARPPIVRYVEGTDFHFACWAKDPSTQSSWKALYAGCSNPKTGTIYIWKPLRAWPKVVAYIMRHEIGHLNGWPANHSMKCN